MRLSLGACLLAGCVVNTPLVQPATTPEPSAGGGTLTCGEVFSTCDVHCATPDCVQACETRGTPEAQRLHAAVVTCAKMNGCLEQTCVIDRCDPEIQACQADAAPTAGSDVGTVEEMASEPAAAPAPEAAGGLVGLWTWGSISGVGSLTATGWRPDLGSGGALRLDADGRYEKSAGTVSNAAGCTIGTFRWARGRWSVSGQTIVFREEDVEVRSSDSCKPANDRRDLPAPETETRRLELLADSASGPPTLRLQAADGKLDTYTRR